MMSVLGVAQGEVEGVGRVGGRDAQRQDFRLRNEVVLQTRFLLQIIPRLHPPVPSTAEQKLARTKGQAGYPTGVGVVKTRDGLPGLG